MRLADALMPTAHEGPPLRIAMLAPPWIAIPAAGYGGIEAVVEQLCDQLVAEGHDVTLFAAPGSRSRARVRSVLEDQHPRDMGLALYEVDHVAGALAAIDAAAAAGAPFDVVHDHCGFAALAIADRISTPVVHTVHGPFDGDRAAFYLRHGAKASLVAISEAQRATVPDGVDVAAVIPNPVTARHWPFRAVKGEHLLWLGRLDEVKGPHRAIAAAEMAGRPLVLAGPVQPGQEGFFASEVGPHLDGHEVRYLGEIGGDRKRRILAEPAALLMPIRWHEPFGMVMVEALVCGTPVIAFPEGAAREVVIDGVNGFLVQDEHEMADAVAALPTIDPADCRASVVERYDVAHVARAYERLYRQAIARAAGFAPSSSGRPAAALGGALG